jgi:cell division protein FtsZ
MRSVTRPQASFTQPVAASAPVMHAPAQPVAAAPQPQAYAADPVAETILAAERDMERELELAVADPLMNELAQAPQADEFRPASRLFALPAEEAPVARPAPVMSRAVPQPEPQMQMREPAPAPVYEQVSMQQDVRGEPSLMASVRMEAEHSRMPKVEDFSPVVKAEIEHRAGVTAPAHAEERGPMGLLKRLTSSLGRKEEEHAPSDMTGGAPAAASQQRRALSPEASLYAPRRGNLDDQGRPVPAQPRSQEEEFDIPAFLRRQST